MYCSKQVAVCLHGRLVKHYCKNILVTKFGIYRSVPETKIFVNRNKVLADTIEEDIHSCHFWHFESPVIENETRLRRGLTWCNAVNPSTLAVLMSVPCVSSRSTSSVSLAAHAARKTHPSLNWILFFLSWGAQAGTLFVSDCSHRFNCSALRKRALFDRVSIGIKTVWFKT